MSIIKFWRDLTRKQDLKNEDKVLIGNNVSREVNYSTLSDLTNYIEDSIELEQKISILEQSIADGIIQSTANYVPLNPDGSLPTPTTNNNFTFVGTGTYGSITVEANKLAILFWDGAVWVKEDEVDNSVKIANEDGDSEDVAASQALASSKVTKEEGKSLAPDKAVKTIENNEIIPSVEWVEVKVDETGNILEGTKRDGTKYFAQGVPTLDQIKAIETKTDSIEITTLGVYLYAIVDYSGAVLFGIKRDGTIVAKGLEADLGNILDLVNSKVAQSEFDATIMGLTSNITAQLNNTNLVVNSLSDSLLLIDNSVDNKLTELDAVLNNINAFIAFKGYFTNAQGLPPSNLLSGQFAYVGLNLSVATVYRVSDALAWEDTGEPVPAMDVDLNSYATKEYVQEVVAGKDFSRIEVNAIYVKTQADFDSLNSALNAVLDTKGPDDVFSINVLLENGVFKFNDTNMFVLHRRDFKNGEINISTKAGNKAIIIGDGDEYTPDDLIASNATHYKCLLKDAFNVNTIFVDEEFEIVEQFDTGRLEAVNQIHRAASNIIVVNATNKVAKLKLPEELNFLKNKDAVFFKNSLLYYSSWYIHKHAKVTHTDSEYLYFVYDSDYVLDGDFYYKGTFPNFWVSNIPNCYLGGYITVEGEHIYIPRRVKKLYSIKYNKLLQSSETNFKALNFVGNEVRGSSLFNLSSMTSTTALINVVNSNNVHVNYNHFENIGNTYVVKNDGQQVDYENCLSNHFSVSFNTGVKLYGALAHSNAYATRFNFNVVKGSSKLFKFYPTVQTNGKSSEINFNVFYDFAYGGIRVGGARVGTRNCSARVSCNILYMTDDYRLHLRRNTVMDAGAIYVFTHQDYTVVESNIIFDYEGQHHYRGIFCDDGMYRTVLRNNLIYRVPNFTIDARRVANSETIHPTNTENVMEYNILFGRYRYQGHPSYPTSCVSRKNILGFDFSNEITSDVVSNVQEQGANILDTKAVAYDKVYISKASIDSIVCSDFIRNHIKLIK